MAVIDKVLVGEGLVVTDGGDNEIAHIDLLMGPRGSAVEDAFCNTLCNNKDGFTSLLAVCAPKRVRPSTTTALACRSTILLNECCDQT